MVSLVAGKLVALTLFFVPRRIFVGLVNVGVVERVAERVAEGVAEDAEDAEDAVADAGVGAVVGEGESLVDVAEYAGGVVAVQSWHIVAQGSGEDVEFLVVVLAYVVEYHVGVVADLVSFAGCKVVDWVRTRTGGHSEVVHREDVGVQDLSSVVELHFWTMAVNSCQVVGYVDVVGDDVGRRHLELEAKQMEYDVGCAEMPVGAKTEAASFAALLNRDVKEGNHRHRHHRRRHHPCLFL
jgi:hypothetical protein